VGEVLGFDSSEEGEEEGETHRSVESVQLGERVDLSDCRSSVTGLRQKEDLS